MLQAKVIRELYSEASNEQKLNVLTDLCKDIPYEEVLNHPIVIHSLKQKICKDIDKIVRLWNPNKSPPTPKDIEYFKYLFMNDDQNFQYFSMFYYDSLKDMMRYIRPTKWKYCKMVDDIIFVSTYNNEWLEFDFERDVIDKKFPPDKIKSFWNDKTVVHWTDF